MPEITLPGVSQTVRYEGAHCGAYGKDCDFESLSDDFMYTICKKFSNSDFEIELESNPNDDGTENEGRFLRCSDCQESYPEG